MFEEKFVPEILLNSLERHQDDYKQFHHAE